MVFRGGSVPSSITIRSPIIFLPKLAFLNKESFAAMINNNMKKPKDGNDTGTEPISNSNTKSHPGIWDNLPQYEIKARTVPRKNSQ